MKSPWTISPYLSYSSSMIFRSYVCLGIPTRNTIVVRRFSNIYLFPHVYLTVALLYRFVGAEWMYKIHFKCFDERQISGLPFTIDTLAGDVGIAEIAERFFTITVDNGVCFNIGVRWAVIFFWFILFNTKIIAEFFTSFVAYFVINPFNTSLLVSTRARASFCNVKLRLLSFSNLSVP